jgi:hypothetical protein
MNITIGSNSTQLKTRYIASIAGAALALSAIAGLSGSLKAPDAGNPEAPSRETVISPRVVAQNPLQVVVVADVEHKERLEASLSANEYLVGQPNPDRPQVIVASNLEKFWQVARDAYESYGDDAQVFDLTALPRDVRPATSNLEADILAGVISTELATYGLAPKTAEPQFGTAADAEYASRSGQADFVPAFVPAREAAEADILASVISTERAAWEWVASQPAAELDILSPGVAQQLQSDILASVISTEYAQYVSLQEQVLVALTGSTFPAHQASEADILASAISTERAAYGNPEHVQPLFGTAADAEYAAQSLNQMQGPALSRAAEPESYPVAVWPRTLALQPMFGTEADAEFAAFGPR